MPNALLEKISKTTKKPISELENLWNKSINEAEAKGLSGEDKYKYATAILEKIHTHDNVSARHVDENGYLHIKDVVITSADVNPYNATNIPNYKELGFNDGDVINVYRPLEEIIKTKDKFNNMPLLDRHIVINSNSENVKKIGTLGSVGRIDGNSLLFDITFWHDSDIEKLEGKDSNGNEVYKPKKGISAGYMADYVKESGIFNGKEYQAKMINLVPNHVAHVLNPRNKQCFIPDGFNFDEREPIMAKDESMSEGSLGDELMDILQKDDKIEVKHNKIMSLMNKHKKETKDNDDVKKKVEDKEGENDKKVVKDNDEKKDMTKDNENSLMSMDKMKEEYFRDKMAKDNVDYVYRGVTKDEMDAVIKEHTKNYSEALSLCNGLVKNNMVFDSADAVYNAVLSNHGINVNLYQTLEQKRDLINIIKSNQSNNKQIASHSFLTMDSADSRDGQAEARKRWGF